MKLVMVILMAVFAVTGCSRVDTYTYKRDRVDQDVVDGNRGFMYGTPPPADDRSGLKRTMFGMDVEVPILPWEKKQVLPPPSRPGQIEEPPMEDQKTIADISILPELPVSKPDKKAVTDQKKTKIKGETIKGESVEPSDAASGKNAAAPKTGIIKGEVVEEDIVEEEEWIK
ncbi:MAG: hypothetical protein ABH885_03100 [Candidatus Omnitrophota bacterium]